MTGYLHPAYADSLAEFGAPRRLPRCGGSILVRPVPGERDCDAMGCYPLFACADWSMLRADLDELAGELVAVSMVADPFGEYQLADLHACFDLVLPFKNHYVVDLNEPPGRIGSRSRRKQVRRALREVEVRVCENPAAFLEEWQGLYAVLAQRHGITGIRRFSRKSFAGQLAVPGMVVLEARHRGGLVGALLLYLQGAVAYGHLCALNETGYALGATCALDWFSFEYLAGKVRWVDLGGGAGASAGTDGGLGAYKAGWATGTRPAYFCGRVLNPLRYAEICRARNTLGDGYFPAYRRGEFG